MFSLDGTIIGLFLVHFCVNSGLSSPGPFFPLLATEEELPLPLIGTATASFALGGLFISLTSHYFQMSMHSQMMFFYSGLMTALSLGLFSILPSLDTVRFGFAAHILRFVQGMSSSLLSSCIQTSITHSYREQAEELSAIQQFISTLSAVFGPGLAAGLYYFGGFTVVYLVFGGLLILFVPLPLCYMKRNRLYEVPLERPSGIKLVRNISILVLAMALLVSILLLSSLEVFLALHLQSLDVSASISALFFMIPPFTLAISNCLVQLISSYVNSRVLIGTGLFIQSLGLFFITPMAYLSPSLGLISLGLALLGLGLSLTTSPCLSAISSLALSSLPAKDAFNASSSLYIFTLLLGELLGPILASFFWPSLCVFGLVMTSLFVVTSSLKV